MDKIYTNVFIVIYTFCVGTKFLKYSNFLEFYALKLRIKDQRATYVGHKALVSSEMITLGYSQKTYKM